MKRAFCLLMAGLCPCALAAQRGRLNQNQRLDLGLHVRRQARRHRRGLRKEVHRRRHGAGVRGRAKKAVWTIDNPDAVKDFYGDHVTVKATADAAKKSVHIDSIAEAK